ncbi:unnamed protein product [Callosobruchus maculatus]|uniref:Uncharacterized protein n=1 Tax=Callosobruchus maculatus TaxID=64391 RepID=A0A653BDS3_CALMS|nr:unnamed protein product [Callosobruchus maculatus]
MGGIRNSQHSPPRLHFKSIYASSICLFNSPRMNQRHFGSFSDVMVTPYFSNFRNVISTQYFSKLCHAHRCL